MGHQRVDVAIRSASECRIVDRVGADQLFLLGFNQLTRGVIGADQEIADDGVLRVAGAVTDAAAGNQLHPCGSRSVRRYLSIPREALKTRASKPRPDRGSESALNSLARAITSCGSEMSAGVILFITSAAVWPSIRFGPDI